MKPDQPSVGDQIAKMIAEAENAAYARGWEDAVATMMAAADKAHPRPPESKKTPFNAALVQKKVRGKKRKSRRHVLKNDGPSQARAVVLEAIKENPRRTGTQVAEIVADKVNKHTVRTQLRKLRIAGEIFQDSQLRWYVPTEFKEAG